MWPRKPWLRWLIILLPGIGFCILSGIGIIVPAWYISILGVPNTTPSLASHFRYLNVLFLSYGIMLFLLFADGRKYRIFLAFLAFGMLGGAAVRTLSLLVDGVPNFLMMLALVGELVLGIIFFLAYRLSATSET